MQLNDLKPPQGARKNRRRVGRGESSGLGKTAGRGHKGQRSRAGSGRRPWFEGGQMPLYRRLPKRGFKPIRRNAFSVVNLRDLQTFEAGVVVTSEMLVAARLIANTRSRVKVLGDGNLSKALTVRAHQFSRAAAEKIRAAGGEIEVLE